MLRYPTFFKPESAGGMAESTPGELEPFARLRRGDTAAFDAIFREWYAPLVRTAEALVRERSVAEEIAQDVMLELWRRREALTIDESPRAYLTRATRNRALNHLRHLRIEKRDERHAIGETHTPAVGERRLVAAELDVAVRQAVADLPPRCREVFELSRVHGLRYAEIATTLNISVKTVEAQMGKALRTLREELAHWLPKSTSL
ncbi:MAG: RNA polymerase sigma-70 factor [Gemmatimonadaceae bacterium]